MRVSPAGQRPKVGQVKAVAVDVDGTLSNEARRIDLNAVQALRKVDDSGVPVMLASGNVLPIAYALSSYLGFSGPIIAENGGIVCYKQQVCTIAESRTPNEAYEYLKTKMNAERLFTDQWRRTEVGLKRDVDLEQVRRILRDKDVEVQTTGWAVHIMQKGMNKFRGVEKACELLGLSAKEIAAIGDSDNDEMMIRECGWGVAVGNAFEGTKRVATYVAKGADGTGIVEGLSWLRLFDKRY